MDERNIEVEILGTLYKANTVSDLVDLMDQDDFNFEQPGAMDNWMNYGFIKKDVSDGDVLKVIGIGNVDGTYFDVMCDNGVTFSVNIKKEKLFFEMRGVEFGTTKELYDWLKTAGNAWFKTNDSTLFVEIEEGITNVSLLHSFLNDKKKEFLLQARNADKVYTARVIDKNAGGFIANIDGLETFIPGSLASANKISNFDDLIGTDIFVMFEDYIYEGDTFIVSNKKYIKHILEEKIQLLSHDEKYTGTITGVSKFGIFVEFDEIFTGLIHVSEMTPETKDEFTFYKSGDEISFYVKEVARNNRIILSEYKGCAVVTTFEDFQAECEDTIQECEIVGVREIGSFVKFKLNESSFIGLFHNKEYPEGFMPQMGMKLKIEITEVNIEENKIFTRAVEQEYNTSKNEIA